MQLQATLVYVYIDICYNFVSKLYYAMCGAYSCNTNETVV